MRLQSGRFPCYFRGPNQGADGPEMLTFVQITDTHIFADREEFLGARPAEILEAAVDDIRARYPEAGFVVHTGDIGGLEGRRADYERYNGLIRPLPMPVFHVPGNHDMVSGEFARSLQPSAGPGVQWEFEKAGWLFVGWNSSARDGSDLSRLLQRHAATPTLLFTHHNILPVGVRWIDRLIEPHSLGLLNVICSHPQVKYVVCGHVHLEKTLYYQGRYFVHTPALSWQFTPAIQDVKESVDDVPAGYRVFTIADDGAVGSTVRRLER